MSSIYDFKALSKKGEEVSFEDFRGKVILIVNTASKCGFTPQFDGLEQLNQEYKDQGLVIIGFPCNQFGKQEPGNGAQAHTFCQLNYGVSFQIMEKVKVNGKDAHPVFKFLKSQTKGFITNSIKWNFTKFLISRDGQVIARFAPYTKPKKLRPIIEKMLSETIRKNS